MNKTREECVSRCLAITSGVNLPTLYLTIPLSIPNPVISEHYDTKFLSMLALLPKPKNTDLNNLRMNLPTVPLLTLTILSVLSPVNLALQVIHIWFLGFFNVVQFSTLNNTSVDLSLDNFPNIFSVIKRAPFEMSYQCTFSSHCLLFTVPHWHLDWVWFLTWNSEYAEWSTRLYGPRRHSSPWGTPIPRISNWLVYLRLRRLMTHWDILRLTWPIFVL